VPPVTEAPVVEADRPANLHGQCTAFAGRAQPGNSRAWERLNELAGGDIDGFCAEVLGAPRSDDEGEPTEGTGQPSDDGPNDGVAAPSSNSQAPGQAGVSRGGGNGRGGSGRG
jgi:hypothetical protein